MSEIIGADHEFHDKDFVTDWAERFVPTPERLQLFDLIRSELQSLAPPDGRVVELGIGPGYLAHHLLTDLPRIEYCGVDFSSPMLDIARQRLSPYGERVSYLQVDRIQDDWVPALPEPVDAIVSTWSLHDLGSQENVAQVYRGCATALQGGGVLINGDFIKPDRARFEYEPGRFEIARHLEMLHSAGFGEAECLLVLEEEIESPTAAQNYACLKAVVRGPDIRDELTDHRRSGKNPS